MRRVILPALATIILTVAPAQAQSLGTASWLLSPYCNRVTMNVRQDGAVFTLDGYDDQCGAAQRAPLTGLATLNPDGTIEFGLGIVTAGGRPVHINARITLPSAGGTWSDSAGNSGAFQFGQSPVVGALPRAVPPSAGDISAVAAGAGLVGGGVAGDVSLAIDSAVVQSRIATACAPGQAVNAVNQDGTVACQSVGGGGDITSVNAGPGLTGGALSGSATLSVAFGGSGFATLAARSNHTHARGLDNTSTAVGSAALAATTTGAQNTALGAFALLTNSAGSDNTAVGVSALNGATGSGNTAVGVNAMTATAGGDNNTALGHSALGTNETGSTNVALGLSALVTVTGGSRNVAVGPFAGSGLTTGSDNIYLHASAGAATEANTMRLGEATTSTFIAGIRGITTGLNDAIPLVIDSNGQVGTVSSSRETKRDIVDLGAISRKVLDLRPVQFTYKAPFADGTTPVQFGLIAEEVDDVLPALVARGRDGRPETVKYHLLPTFVLAEVQRLERERTQADAERAELARQVSVQARAIEELRTLVAQLRQPK